MVANPFQKFFVPNAAIGYAEANSNNIVIATFNRQSVYRQEGKHDVHADPFVSIYKSMV